ncbi:hypothetical protein D9758_002900 [Tetrapyrgos nigripes]|uniref:Uncharacterized protein n=1 Tax=Tetrapyrgos nigripes TaxID=182062 RepID=A0A8H5LT54_9AGAR|nr:hypothetical protein D9758_002900 [Tetrapyrgos nigripes]
MFNNMDHFNFQVEGDEDGVAVTVVDVEVVQLRPCLTSTQLLLNSKLQLEPKPEPKARLVKLTREPSVPNPNQNPKQRNRNLPTFLLYLWDYEQGHHPSLRTKIGRFQDGLLAVSSTSASTSGDSVSGSTGGPRIRGLDPSIIINPRRFHFTLGVMTLENDRNQNEVEVPAPDGQSKPGPGLGPGPPQSEGERVERKTVKSALALLRSLGPQIRAIVEECDLKSELGGGKGKEKGLEAPLDLMGVFESRDKKLQPEELGARVLWLSPLQSESDSQAHTKDDNDAICRRKLARVSELVHKTFKEAGYITDTRPLKLHCTVINTSHRKIPKGFRGPAANAKRRELFSFDDILASKALRELRGLGEGEGQHGDSLLSSTSIPATGSEKAKISLTKTTRSVETDIVTTTRITTTTPTAVKDKDRTIPVSLGTYSIPEIQLCIMGSHGPEDEYVSVGGVGLG